MMIEVLRIVIFALFLLTSSIPSSHAESSTCLTIYKQGGAPAVFQSPKCPRWTLSTESIRRRRMENCQSYMHIGRRKSQEDRTFCALDLKIPFPGRNGVNEVMVGMVAVFDGHNGAEASEMASKLLLEYFFLHVYFLLDGIYSVSLEKSTGRLLRKVEAESFSQVLNLVEKHRERGLYQGRFKWMLPEIFDGSFQMEILKESLVRAIHDIDATVSKEAFRNNLDSGSTATIVLIVDNQILVSNVGDSKAILCSEKFQSPQEVKDTMLKLYRQRRRNGVVSPAKEYGNFKMATSLDGSKHFLVKELTRDHHPDRDDERLRVEAAGGFVEEWGGVPRVNGELAVSRAIGDVSFKSYGVISSPEVTDWQTLTINDTYLVAASDGVFEKMTTQDVCDLLWDVHTLSIGKSEISPSCIYSLAECIVNTAFERGSMDNIAAVVVPLKSNDISGSMLNERNDEEEDIGSSASGPQKLSYNNAFTSGLVQLAYVSQMTTNFNRLLVERTQGRYGFFYLYEDLNDKVDYKFGEQRDEWDDGIDNLPQALPEAFGHNNSYPLNVYSNQNLCLHFGMDTQGDKGQCINPESFSRFLGLLESIPFPDTVANSSGSSEYDTPSPRYILKRRFGRGSYGEVWLAFDWNHSQDGDLSWNHSVKNCTANNVHLDQHDHNTSTKTNSSGHHCNSSPDNGNFFILKRIMLLALKSCHDRSITHRDIKPENMVICIEDERTGRCLKGIPIGDEQYKIKMRIIDFGSAIDEFTMKHLYGSNGPSRSEQTYDYTPPEALLNTKWFEGPKSIVLKYDMWSVGVVMLELILGSPHVFQLNARTRTLLDQHLEGWNEDVKELAYKLRSLMEMCILIPGSTSKRHQSADTRDHSGLSPASWKCSEEFFSQQVKSRDPLKQGFPNIWSLRLVRQLLLWNPEDRLSVDDALRHPYFQQPPQV